MRHLRGRLGWKLFASYLVIILTGVVTLAVAADYRAPTALARHMIGMERLFGSGSDAMMADLLGNFQNAINEILLFATIAAILTAAIVSAFVTRRIVNPVQEMKAVSRRIADGHYEERVHVRGEDELADLARAFNHMAQAMAQTEERRRQLIGDVAHELRTPLSSIVSVMEGLQDGVLPAQPETFADVEREAGRLQRLVHDLQELSRAEAHQISLEPTIVDPTHFIRTAVNRLDRQFQEKGVAMVVALPDALPHVTIDVSRLTQVMINLLGNALQYTPEGGQVMVAARLEGATLVITVADSGIGLSAEQMQQVFERFYRVDKSRSRAGGGSGIGLTISKHLVEAHNGRLTVTSPGLGQGSTFTITLPRTD